MANRSTFNSSKNSSNSIESALYIVPTPIGNLLDITFRSVKVLSSVDIIACEDTRVCGMLLRSLDIDFRGCLCSYHNFNEGVRSGYLVEQIRGGKSVALVSDSGMPCISDPGYKLVREVIGAGLKIIPLPGPTAFVSALVASGFSVHNFVFLGFPPQKKGRLSFIRDALSLPFTVILYESSHRIIKLIEEISGLDSCRDIFIGREITKIFEEHIRFNTSEFLSGSVDIVPKGEFVVVIRAKS